MQLLEKHFDIAFTAPDGIKILRELILTLAMQGKLVPQDPNEQPASELLKNIETEKKRLVKEGKIKAAKPLPPITHEEDRHKAPVGWEWVRLGSIVNITTGKLDANAAVPGGMYPFFTCSNTPLKIDRYSFNTSAVLLAGNGDFNLKYYIGKFDAYQRTYVIEPVCIDLKYLFYSLNKNIIEITKNFRGSAIPYLRLADITHPILLLPPLGEQRRIVAKIDELMAHCDELEKLRNQREQKRLNAHKAALNSLLSASETNSFSTSWSFITRNFGELYSVKENVAELRKAILQLAVMGKLVPQDPNDQPARELLKEIQAEKRRLVKEGKIKAAKLLPPIKPEEVPYKLPKSWEWVRFEEITFQITDGTHHTPQYVSEGVPFLSVKDMSSGYLDFSYTRFISQKQHEELCRRCKPQKGDLLLTKVGTTGIPVLIETEQEFSIFVSVALIKFPLSYVFGPYLCWLVKSPIVKKQSEEGTEGVGNKNLVLRKISNFLLPLPPLSEQRRIVAKVDQLMALCDNLDNQIFTAAQKQSTLLNAVMAQV